MNGQHPAVALTSQITRLLDAAGELSLLGLAGDEVDMLLEEQLSVISRLQTMLADLVEQAAVLDRPAQLAAPSMAAWLRGRFGLAPAAAARLVRDVADLRAVPTAAQAARLGAIPVQAAVEIGHAVTALPDEVGPQIRAEGAAVLLGFAVGEDGPPLAAQELRLIGRHLHEILDPDAADLLLAQRLEREERAVYRRRFLSITDDHDSGGVRLRGLLTVEAGASLRAVLAPLTAPRPATTALKPGQDGEDGKNRETGDSGNSGNSAVGAVGLSSVGAAGGDASFGDGTALPLPDERSGGQRSADALHEACERLLAQGDLPASGGDRPQILITVDHDRLAAGIAAATLPDGNQLTAAAVRRLACDAGLLPAVLGTASQPLDLGRTARTASAAQRKALILRDRGCDFPGCDRPPSWCQAHHIQPWQDLGLTDLANLVLVCGFHHRLIHRDHWEIQPAHDGIRPLFTPPAWLDPLRRPRRNLQHHLRDLYQRPRQPGDDLTHGNSPPCEQPQRRDRGESAGPAGSRP